MTDSKTLNGSDGSNVYNYELSEHLKTLHSLVTEYSSQGMYEVAMALCKQAIQNETNNISAKKPILSEDSEGVNGDIGTAEICSLDIATLQNIYALVYR